MFMLTVKSISLAKKSCPVLCSVINGLVLRSRRTITTLPDHTPNKILHIGSGSFHRAHQAWYLHRLNVLGDQDWSYALGNIRADMNPVLEALAAQDGVYTLETVTPKGERKYEIIRSIKKIVPWDQQIQALVEAGAAPETKIISFTVTEAGYYLDLQRALQTNNPDICADLKGARKTIYGAIAAILEQRMQRGTGKVSLLSCDNVISNGDSFKKGMTEFLRLREQKKLKDWFEANTSCPNAMVDRITPRPTPDVRERVLKATGVDDRAPVMGESFIQWVIEDKFCAGRPQWEQVGVQMVDDVMPYEDAKIKLLNTSYNMISWAGSLLGKVYMYDSAQDPDIYAMVKELIDHDVIPTLQPSPIDLCRYRDVVLDRFCNPHIHDTNQRVVADGFAKIPGFIAPTLRACFDRQIEPTGTATVLAVFFRFLERWHHNALPCHYTDGSMDPTVAHGFFASADPVKAFLSERQLWGSLIADPSLERVFRAALTRVDQWIAKRDIENRKFVAIN